MPESFISDCVQFMSSCTSSWQGELKLKEIFIFDPHDYHVMIINKPVTSCIYISVGCLMTPSLVWLMSPWLTGIIFDHRTLIMHFTCSLQNGGAEKGGCLERSSHQRRRGTVGLMAIMISWLGPALPITTEVGRTLTSLRCWETCLASLQRKSWKPLTPKTEQAGWPKSWYSH